MKRSQIALHFHFSCDYFSCTAAGAGLASANAQWIASHLHRQAKQTIGFGVMCSLSPSGQNKAYIRCLSSLLITNLLNQYVTGLREPLEAPGGPLVRPFLRPNGACVSVRRRRRRELWGRLSVPKLLTLSGRDPLLCRRSGSGTRILRSVAKTTCLFPSWQQDQVYSWIV